jgi:hypothetical protein
MTFLRAGRRSAFRAVLMGGGGIRLRTACRLADILVLCAAVVKMDAGMTFG